VANLRCTFNGDQRVKECRLKRVRPKQADARRGVQNKTTAIKEALSDFDFGAEFVEAWADLKANERMQALKWIAEFMFVKPKGDESSDEDLKKALDDVRVMLDHRKPTNVR
jgi:hypothetical protein